MKILTVTLNPAIDHTIYLDELSLGTLHRIEETQWDVSGKGINVSTALKRFGVVSVPFCLVGGERGRLVAQSLKDEGLEPEVTWLPGETRVNTKLVEAASGRLTELNESGPRVPQEELRQFCEQLLGHVKPGTWLALSGSLPPGVPAHIYADMVRAARQKGGRVALDADGEPLKRAVMSTPDILKVNAGEAGQLIGKEITDAKEAASAVVMLRGRGIPIVAITLGAEGAVLGFDDGIIHTKPPVLSPASTTGCGDAFLAGLFVARIRGEIWQEAAQYATAVSAATALLPGTCFPEPPQVEALLKRVECTSL